MSEWDERLRQWREELDLAASIEQGEWVPLPTAEADVGVSRSALRSWYRTGQIRTRLIDGPHGPQRLVALGDVRRRAASSPRIRKRAEDSLMVETQVTLLRHRVDALERRLAAMEDLLGRGDASPDT